MGWPREKLVRRHVPDQLRAHGETIETRIAEPGEMRGLLIAKLKEEMAELAEALDAAADDQIIEELVDVFEVIDAMQGPPFTTMQGLWLVNEVHKRQIDKRDEKGRFTNIVMKLDEPIPMVLHCPKCQAQHIDQGIYATRVHRSHLCAKCGNVWRPFDKATVGVTQEFLTAHAAVAGASAMEPKP